MTPEHFHDLLERATVNPPPFDDDVDRALTHGRRSLRWRHASGGAAIVAAIALVGGVGLVTRDGHTRDHPPTATKSRNDQKLVDTCKQGSHAAGQIRQIFGSGPPTVEVAVRTDFQWVLALQSADGRYWAKCTVALTKQESPATLDIYTSAGTHKVFSYGGGSGCGMVHGAYPRHCPTYTVYSVDRLPAAVAAVRYDLVDGTSITSRTVDGYVVLNYLAPKPPKGSIKLVAPFHRITYLDRAGQPLAAQADDGSGSGPDASHVGDLPLLSAYPGLGKPA